MADPLAEEPVPNLPGEHAGALRLVLRDLFHHGGRGDARLGAADLARLDGSGLIVPADNTVCQWTGGCTHISKPIVTRC